VIEATVMDRRWKLVLDCMGAEGPPFSKATLVAFRKRLIEKDLDRRLIERTVELAARIKGFGRGRCGRRWTPVPNEIYRVRVRQTRCLVAAGR
jgi:hypothetical protein